MRLNPSEANRASVLGSNCGTALATVAGLSGPRSVCLDCLHVKNNSLEPRNGILPMPALQHRFEVPEISETGELTEVD